MRALILFRICVAEMTILLLLIYGLGIIMLIFILSVGLIWDSCGCLMALGAFLSIKCCLLACPRHVMCSPSCCVRWWSDGVLLVVGSTAAKLASSLPDVALRGRAPATVRQYSGAFCRWKKWASAKGVDSFPASPFFVSLYLNYLIQKSSTVAPVEQAVHALSWVHSIAVVDDPTQHPLVGHVVAGAKRILARPTCKKEPITPDILQRLVSR